MSPITPGFICRVDSGFECFGDCILQWVNVLLIALTALLLVPVCVLCAECFAALFPSRRFSSMVPPRTNGMPTGANDGANDGANNSAETSSSHPRPRLAVLIPAHNEEVVLDETLASIVSQLKTGD